MAKPQGPTDESRRKFLTLAASAAPAAAAMAAGAGEASAEEVQAEGKGLRKTPHVEAYLKSARF